jgi:ParB-like chromosome segregation protein Spo0J
VLAARVLGHIDIPTIELSHMTDIQKRAYIIADNKLALNAGWDDEVLGLEIAELKEFGFDLSIMGFNAQDIKNLLNENDSFEISDIKDESKNLLMIECVSEKELETLFEEMKERGLECKILS